MISDYDIYKVTGERYREELDKMSIGDKDMKELSKEIKGLNEDSEFIEFLTAEEEEEKYLNTVKNIEYQKGIDDGIEQGSLNEKKIIAKNLLNLNMSIEEISNVTGLTKEEIEKI